MLFEWAVDAIKRTTNVDDKEEIIKNVASTKMDTIVGPIDFTTPVEQGTTKVGVRSFPNVCIQHHVDGPVGERHHQQPWSTKIWPYDLLIVEPTMSAATSSPSQADNHAGYDVQVNNSECLGSAQRMLTKAGGARR